MEASGDSGGITTVECPVCQSDLTVSLPRESKILTLTTEPEDAPDYSENGASRPRNVQMHCIDGHPVTVFFDW